MSNRYHLILCLILISMPIYIAAQDLYTNDKEDLFTRVTEWQMVEDTGDTWGSAWIDYDNDGWLDLFTVNAHARVLFYHNDSGTGFSQITEDTIVNEGQVGLYFTDCAWGDADNDGDNDVYIATRIYGSTAYNNFYLNAGDGSFTRVSTSAVIGDLTGSVSANWIDYDNDGDLDLFAANASERNNLYRNDSTGFTKITSGSIVTDFTPSTYGGWADYDNDGDMDLFVANAYGSYRDALYTNDGDGTFTKVNSGPVVNRIYDSQGCNWGDYDNDGDLDLYVLNARYSYPNNSYNYFFQNNGDGTFIELTDKAITSESFLSYSSAWVDYDNDGDLDLFVSHLGPNRLYENNGMGDFIKITESDLVLDAFSSGAGVWGDFDRDGDQDVYVGDSLNNRIYINNANGNNWINIHCIGTVSNHSAIGTRIRLKATINSSEVWQIREIIGKSGRMAHSSLNAHIGLGDASIIDSIIIKWPSGITQIMVNISTNQFLTVTEELPVICGDTNGDETVNVSDAVHIINYVFVGGDPPDPIETGDCNCDDTCNVSDAVWIINYVFVGGNIPCDTDGDETSDC
jgi:ASPIC and UnbV/FG-GAP-like repeat/Dockerin type I domain